MIDDIIIPVKLFEESDMLKAVKFKSSGTTTCWKVFSTKAYLGTITLRRNDSNDESFTWKGLDIFSQVKLEILGIYISGHEENVAEVFA